ncbi:hypothetical protein BC827DRAFT_394935 [Russula dissimulans]|nr:hypothetical protein BC827DRAFT_394935 [Russula dissimulans]
MGLGHISRRPSLGGGSACHLLRYLTGLSGQSPASTTFVQPAQTPPTYSRIHLLQNTMATNDPVRDLNNLLQRYPVGNGNLSQFLSWSLYKDGPDHQRTHYATAKLNGKEIGFGTGFSIGNAKREAAIVALRTLNAQGY